MTQAKSGQLPAIPHSGIGSGDLTHSFNHLSLQKLAVRLTTPHVLIAHLLVVIGLLLLSYLTINRSFGEFGFYYDDWRFLMEVSQPGGIETVFPTRPLHRPLTEWVFNTIGYNPHTGYLMLAVLLAASAFAMYWVMNVIFPRRRALAVVTATLYLLYPGDLSRSWITAGLTANRPAVLLALISLGLLFTGLRLRHRLPRVHVALAASSILVYFASLMLYEAQALLVPGLGLAGAIWIGMSGRGLTHRSTSRETIRNAINAVAPHVVVFVAFLAWRFVLVQTGTDDRFTATANFNPLYLVRQFIGVYYFNYLEQPLEVVSEAVPFLGQFGAANLLFMVIGAALVVGGFFMFGGKRIWRASPTTAKTVEGRTARSDSEKRFYRNVLLVALALTGVVYSVLLPHDHIISASGLDGPFVSRLNAAGAVVVAIAGAASLMFAWSWASGRWHGQQVRVNIAAAGGLMTVIALLVTFHGIVQRDYAEAWQLQQLYVGQIVESLPELTPGTHIHLEGAPSRLGSSYVFMYSTEQMMQLIYDDPTISVSVDNSADSRYALTSAGLFFDGELLAPRDRVERFKMYGFDCGDRPGPACGRLIIDGTNTAGSDEALLTASAHSRSSAVDGLLGISSSTASGFTETPSSSEPLFAAPSDAPPE